MIQLLSQLMKYSVEKHCLIFLIYPYLKKIIRVNKSNSKINFSEMIIILIIKMKIVEITVKRIGISVNCKHFHCITEI